MPEDWPRDPWLSQFPAQAQPLIIAWFSYAAHQDPRTPEALLAIVERVVGRKLSWSTTTPTREACTLLLLALRHQRQAARTYAATFVPTAR